MGQGGLEGGHVHHLHIAGGGILALLGHGGEPEVPCAVQRLVESALGLGPRCLVVVGIGLHLSLAGVWHVCCHTGEFVDGEDSLVLPDGGCYLGLLHLLYGEPGSLVDLVGVGYLHQVAVYAEHLLLVGRNDAVHALLSLHGLQTHQRVAGIGRVCRPLEQPCDALVVTAVVEVAVVESTAYEMATQREGLDTPVLAAVQRVLFLGTDACIVGSVVAVAQHQCGVLNATETVGAVVVAAEGVGLLDSNALLQRQERGLVGGDGAVLAGSYLGKSPLLQLVATVHLAILHAPFAHAKGTLLEWIDEAPRTRQFVHDEQLTLVFRGNAVHLVEGTLSEVLGIDTGGGQYHTQ